jgi:phosphate transport system substrate-binding protein
MHMKRTLVALAALLVPALAAAGTVTVKGSDTMVILAQRWAEDFMKKNPAKKIQVTGGGSGTGIAALVNGTTDIANASRAIKDREAEQVKQRFKVQPTETVVARDGVAVYVNDQNPVAQLTVEQVKAIYLGDVRNWKEVGGQDAPIVLYSRENSSGTYVFVKEHVLGNEDFAPEAQTLPGTAAVVNAVAKEAHGIGYGGAAYAKGVKEVKIVGKDGQAYLPNAENVKSGKYALARPLFIYTRGNPQGEAKEFIDFCLSQPGQAIVTQVGYYPIK